MMSVVCSCIFYPKGENRVQDLVISALNLDTHLLILISLPAPMKKALNTKAIIQLCVSVSKGQLAISTVSPLAASYNIISNRFETLAFFFFSSNADFSVYEAAWKTARSDMEAE